MTVGYGKLEIRLQMYSFKHLNLLLQIFSASVSIFAAAVVEIEISNAKPNDE